MLIDILYSARRRRLRFPAKLLVAYHLTHAPQHGTQCTVRPGWKAPVTKVAQVSSETPSSSSPPLWRRGPALAPNESRRLGILALIWMITRHHSRFSSSTVKMEYCSSTSIASTDQLGCSECQEILSPAEHGPPVSQHPQRRNDRLRRSKLDY